MDDQPRKDNDKQIRARRPSKRPKKIGKQRRAREKQGTHTHTLRVHSLKKGVSKNEAPGPVGTLSHTHAHLRSPEKLIRTYRYVEVAANINWREKDYKCSNYKRKETAGRPRAREKYTDTETQRDRETFA